MVSGAYKAGAVIEAAFTVGAATASTLAHGAASVAGGFTDGPGVVLRGLAREPFEGPRRYRVLTSPQRALDTLEPYAKLHIEVIQGKDLVPMDNGMVHPTSDPFVEVYVNDVLHSTSGWKAFTNNPKWDFDVAVEVFSPKTIVRVQIVDRDNLKSNDVIGFVEFPVYDLRPSKSARESGTLVSGWFELRRKERLIGMATDRVEKHMGCRDENDPEHDYHEPGHKRHHHHHRGAVHRLKKFAAHSIRNVERVASGSPGKARTHHHHHHHVVSANGKAPASPPQAPTTAASAGSPAKVPSSPNNLTNRAPCCGRLPLSDSSSSEEEENTHHHDHHDHHEHHHHHKHGRHWRPNGGEVRMKMWLEADAKLEWYAFCFPEPTFQFMPDLHLDLALLYTKIVDVLNLVDVILQKTAVAFRFIFTWRCRPLSLVFVSCWWLAWLWPRFFLPVWPLLATVWLFLLRREKFNKRVLWHSNVAPLDAEGFALVASYRDTDQMEVWLVRLLGSMGYQSTDRRKLRELAGLSFRNAKPVIPFAELEKRLGEQAWICKNVPPRRCHQCHEGHVLVKMGQKTENWTCMNHGGCQHPLTNKFKHSVLRYHCEECDIDFCEPCVARRGAASSPTWTGFAAHWLPHPALVILTKVDHWVDDIHEVLTRYTGHYERMPFDASPESTAKARRLYVANAVTALFIAVVVRILQRIPLHTVGSMSIIFWKVVMIMLVTYPILMQTSFAKSLATNKRAKSEHRECVRRREEGIAARWAFFTPEEAQRVLQGGPAGLAEVRVVS